MTIEEFWNAAFLNSLCRLSVEDAKMEADSATEACIKHWNSHRSHYEPTYVIEWKNQPIGSAQDPHFKGRF
ncbi:hypothetical protein [Stenotrophomonas sp.]|uniref:hypothetical protein n=1 Tax=Stenotrophomonas sp. TaxID=69392 RepID=UPI0029BA0114|nr:hypothetical protein [Stenotrophomonas sp.]MDX3934344.1 hypothetical protein [Stenotrophomonas sp.]